MDLNESPNLLTVKQASDILFSLDDEVGRNRIYDWIKRGYINANKMNNRWYITKNEIERILD